MDPHKEIALENEEYQEYKETMNQPMELAKNK